MQLSDLACLAALDSLERSLIPADCDMEALWGEGLIEPAADGWRLTVKGRLTLTNLRSLERQRQNG